MQQLCFLVFRFERLLQQKVLESFGFDGQVKEDGRLVYCYSSIFLFIIFSYLLQQKVLESFGFDGQVEGDGRLVYCYSSIFLFMIFSICCNRKFWKVLAWTDRWKEMADEAGGETRCFQNFHFTCSKNWQNLGKDKIDRMKLPSKYLKNQTKMRIYSRSGGKQNSVEFLCVETLRFSPS